MTFEFDRYINGQLMAEGVTIERQGNLPDAMREAARIASRGPNGEAPVLVLRAEAAERALAERAGGVKPLPERAPYEVLQVLGREYETTGDMWAALRDALTTEPAAQEGRQEAGADAVRFLYKHGALTHIAAREAVELLTSNGFEISRRPE